MAEWVNSPVWWTYFIILLIVFIILVAAAASGRTRAWSAHLAGPGHMQGAGMGAAVVGFIILAIVFLLFAIGCYQADTKFATDMTRTLFRTFFGFLVAFLILYAIMIWTWNLKGAFFCALFAFLIMTGLLPLVATFSNVSGAWWMFLFFCYTALLLSMTGRVKNENLHNVYVHNMA